MNRWIAGSVVGLCMVLAVVMNWVEPRKSEVQKVDQAASQEVQAKLATLQIPFIQNKGQMNGEVSFYAQTFAGTMFVTKDGQMVYAIQKTEDRSQKSEVRSQNEKGVQIVTLRESLVEGKITEIKGEDEAIGKVNSFIGNDPSKWRRDIATYSLVNLGEVYPGIGLKLKAYGKNVEKLFEVKPGANPEEIRVHLEGSKDLKVNEGGELVVTTEVGDVKFTKPVAYQEIGGERVNVEASYSIDQLTEKMIYGFKVGSYNKNHGLVIDPLLASTYLGGASVDYPKAIATDSNNNIYVTGYTASAVFPRSFGTPNFAGGVYDVFITKFNSDLQFSYSTLFGGSGNDQSNSLAIALDGNNTYILITGDTTSTDLPFVPGVGQGAPELNQYHGGGDAFVAKFDVTTTLDPLMTTYIGGSGEDNANVVKIDEHGDVYIGGKTRSGDFPIVDAHDDYDTYSGGDDCFISKLDGGLTTLIASTYIGAGGDEGVADLAIDPDGDIVFTGDTSSSTYPATVGSYDTSYNLWTDVFVSKMSGDLGTLAASTFIGSGADEKAAGIAIDNEGNIYIAGYTASLNGFPKTQGAYDTTAAGGDQQNAFISKFNNDLTALKTSTYLGGLSRDYAKDIAIGPSGDVYVFGLIDSTWLLRGGGFPVTKGAYDTVWNDDDGVKQVFVSKFNSDLSVLYASSYLGGFGNIFNTDLEDAAAITIDTTGSKVYVIGSTDATNFPIEGDVTYTTIGGSTDAFISSFTPGLSKDIDGPTALNVTAVTPTRVYLNWTDNSNDETGFKIERKRGGCSSKGWSLIKQVNPNVTEYRNNKKFGSGTYSYRVRACKGNKHSTYSNCKSVITPSTDSPDAPSGLRAISTSSSTIGIYWFDNSDDETHFAYTKTYNGTTNLSRTATSNVSSVSLQAPGNRLTTSYSFTVKACSGTRDNNAVCSQPTNTAVVPFRPRDFSVDATSVSIEVTWLDESDNETGFQLQRKTGGCGAANSAWQNVQSPGPFVNQEVYYDVNVIPGTAYGYRMRSYTRSDAKPYAYGYSQWTQCVEETVPNS